MKGIKSIMSMWKLYLPELCQVLAVMLGGGILGIILVRIVMGIDPTEGYITLGSFIALFIGIGMMALGNMFSFAQKFNMAISMGCTRKNFFLSYWAVTILFTAIETMLVLGMTFFETKLGEIFYAGSIGVSPLSALTDGRVLVGILVFLPAFSMLLGILLVRFGIKAFWVLWGLWMVAAVGGERVTTFILENPESMVAGVVLGIGNFVKDTANPVLIILIVAVSFVLFAVSAILIRRQAITQ